MLTEFDNATTATSAAVVGAASLALFAGWNCLADLWPWNRRRRAAAENRRLADECAGTIVVAYGPRHDERRRASLRKRIGEIVFQALSADGGTAVGGPLPGKKAAASGAALVVQRKPPLPATPR